MLKSQFPGGARLAVTDGAPSIDLATLGQQLARAIPAAADSANVKAFKLFSYEQHRIRVNTRGVISRLLLDTEFKTAFAPGEHSGFLRDAEMPPFGTAAKMGGRLVQGTQRTTATAVKALHEVIKQEVTDSLGTVDWAALTASQMRNALQAMEQSVQEKTTPLPPQALLVPIEFAEADRPSTERERDIARLLSGIETVDGRDWLELILTGVERKLLADEIDPEEIDFILDAIRRQKERPGSQMLRFLEFLEDEAMARVRLHVCLQIMETVAAHSNKAGFKSYVQRVHEAFEAFASQEGEPLVLDISTVYGVNNTTDLSEFLRQATFYGCLPVWCAGSVQLFEQRIDPERHQPIAREVAYHFRVNGLNPQTGSKAFVTQLEQIKEQLLVSPGTDKNVKRSLARLVFLSLVLPPSLHEASSEDLRSQAAAIAKALQDDPVREIQRLHSALFAQCDLMMELAKELIRILKTKSTPLVTDRNRAVKKLFISLHKDLFDWQIVCGLSSEHEDVLVKADQGSDTLAWFSRIRVSTDPWPSSVASIWVETDLKERSLAAVGEAQTVAMRKDFNAHVLPVRLVPYVLDQQSQHWTPALPNLGTLDVGHGIDIEYDLRTLTLSQKPDREKAQAEQFRTATVAAMSLLIYLVLFEFTQRATAVRKALTMTLVRLQPSGKHKDSEADARDGNTAIYAISQAVENALARELPVKLQGLTTENASRWKHRGALAALQASLPLTFPHEGALDKVAVVSYVTRPCDRHPKHPDADGYLFVSRTYFADRQGEQTKLRVGRMLSRLVENRQDFKVPHLIFEEIARLQTLGYYHILMLSHDFGNRHIGRAAERHAPHAQLQFLNEAANRFPKAYLYPLRRDVFKATRLRRRKADESAFEVRHHAAHQRMYQDRTTDILRSLLPIYTFATLHVVDEGEKPQSGFCTYFFDAEHRISDFQRNETIRANILGTGEAEAVRRSLISVLRAIHFMESEKSAENNRPLLPVLDPFAWATPTRAAAAGELPVVSRRGSTILLSLPALLAHVTPILYGQAVDDD